MQTNKPLFRILLTLITTALLVAIVILSIKFPATPPAEETVVAPVATEERIAPADDFDVAVPGILDQIKLQENVDASLMQELQSGMYTFENPLVVVNPYNASPLTALVIFRTEEPENISIHVAGKDSYSNVDFTFDGYTQDHIIPVYGLYADTDNAVTLTQKNQSGAQGTKTLTITTEPIPQEISDIYFVVDSPEKDLYQPGFNFTYINGRRYTKSAFDINGDYRWILTYYLVQSAYYGNDGKFVFAQGASVYGDVLFYETNALGRIYRVYYAPYGVHHDVSWYDDNLLITGSIGATIDDLIYEIDTKTGEISHTLDLKNILQRSRLTGFVDVTDPDWIHVNNVEQVENTDKIVVSGRNQSAIVELSWPDGQIDWILAPHYGWFPMYEQYLLTPIGDNFEWPYNQHDPEILPDMDNNPDTIDILVFDNGNQRYSASDIMSETSDPSEQGFTRIVQYRINTKDRTVEQIWQFGQEYGPLLNSTTCGSVQLLANGNRLGLFNVGPLLVENNVNYSTAFEVTADSEIVWSVQGYSGASSGSYPEYRMTRMNIYGSNANDLGIGTPVENLIPQEILSKYIVTE